MQTVGIFEAKARLSELVKSGKVVTITNHRKPVAKLRPVLDETHEFLVELERQCARANAADTSDNLDDFGDLD